MSRSALGLCLLLTLIHGADFSEPQPKYMLLVPTVLKANNEQRFCLQMSHFNESVTVTVALETGKENITLLEKEVTQPGEDNCVTFKTPASDEARVGYITLEVVGNTLHFRKKKSVLIRPLHNLVFIQTDKAIYKPGQKVQFRIAALDETFRAVSEKLPMVYVEDAQRNRIVQWLNVETKKGIAEESFPLPSEPLLGTYKLVAERQSGSQIKQHFSVEEYVLPKFEVKVTVPSVMTIQDEEVEVIVCGKYTYGKPVAGRIDVQVCRKFTDSYSSCRLEQRSVCEDFSHEADKTGCFSQVVKTKIFQLKRSGYEMKLVASAKITEEGTGVILTGEGHSDIKKTIAKVSFRQLDSHFKKGIPLYGQIFLEDASGKPIPDKNVTIFVGYHGKNFTYTTGSDGTADFSIDTKSFPASSINLRAVYKTGETCYSHYTLFPTYEEASRSVSHFYSRTQSYIKFQPIYRTLSCEENEKFTVFYALSPEGVGNVSGVVFHHLVMAKGEIVDFGKHEVKLTSAEESHGQFTFTLPVNINTAPIAKGLVYLVLESGEVIADSVSFKVENCFTNKVKLSFSANEALPGSQVDLTLFAQPNSLCALRGVDVSVSLLKPEAELTAKSIYDLLPVTQLSGYNHNGHYLEEEREDPCLKLDPIFMNGVYYTPSTPNWNTDTYAIFKSLGLKGATNMMIRIPIICAQEDVAYYDYAPQASLHRGGAVPMSMPMRVGLESELIMEDVIESVRKLFPETWLWDLIEIDSIGHSNLKVTVPDSITTWKVGMFCTSEEDGFGLTQPVSVVAFQPFFLEANVPYSAIRGEVFRLKATVLNYLKETIRVNIGLEKSDEFTAKKISTDDEDHCIDANGQVTVSWEVTMKSLDEVNFTISAETLPGEGHCGNEIVNTVQGRRDIVIKSMLVQPEGIEKQETQNSIICGKGSEISKLISLKLPENLVEGSARAYFSVIGDLMGTSMQNLGNLLQMPFGCGEQNMVLFTPNIYILDYLNGTNQLTPAIKAKALSYLTTGYQRQMAYKHPDGSYSAFGPGSRGYGQPGNTWLTAFVMKSFARAQSYIYIDPKHISDALAWLTHQQKENGCFRNTGYLFNNAMKGGVDDETTLATYITIALLEYPLSTTHIVVRNALFCLESALNKESNIYTQALMAHAFTLAGKMDLRARLLQSLQEKAIMKDDTVHLHRPEVPNDSGRVRDIHRRPASYEVEMTSHMLLAMLSKPDVSTEDLTAASKVVSWLVQQQNSQGGFLSTQDTVVALQALAVYGYHTVSHDGPREVTLTLDNAQVAKFTVEDSNRLLLQKAPLSSVPGEYTATITGTGCVYIQTNLKYNIPHPEGEAPFNISVSTVPEICTVKSLKSFNILVNVSYIGNRENSNMALVEIKLPSGYTPNKSSVKQLRGHNLISRAEAHPNKVIVYFEKLGKDMKSFTFSVEQEIPVGNLRAATATIFDYYETDDIAVTKYFHPCSNNGDGAQSTE
ncbi:LOW QUALITY PROTEIN: alpha-2-macroglobulin-like [Bufo gargarizans]|uniref:LOW QUALITY PROTEIN: alpha-2-macroglobulin-like n=1 Tax=Bufo gargarizans TaxID=30331 RepID=UPI001CF138AB|nr:LOW QUALITY PROTEIN: alpha-2-macroglobulin-like [Bufo gargarizans]